MAETVLGFRIEVKGTEQETTQLVKLGNSIDQLKARLKLLNDLRRKGIPLTAKQAKERQLLNTQLKATTKQYNALNKKILQNNSVTKKQTSFTQKMGSALKTAALSSLGLAAGIALATRIIGSAINTFIKFEETNSKLEAVLGANEVQMEQLKKQSMELGSATAFTATQVAELQIEYAKLGFPTSDILQMTEATLNGAAALGSDLGEQAALTGATLKQYGLDANKAAEVNDILATAASKSALDFSKLSTALPIVGATANAVGVNLKQTTSLLGKLSDRGLDASTSGTSLRNVFLELSKQGLTMNEAMNQINGSTDKAKTSMELFGKRGATAGLILADMEGVVTGLDEALVNVDGAAKDMADTMLDNLGGDITIFKSIWEGLVLEISNGGGVFSKVSRSIVQGFSNILQGVTELFRFDFNNINEGIDSYVKALTGIDLGLDQITPKVNLLTKEINKLNAEQLKANSGELSAEFVRAGLSAEDAAKKVADLYKTKLELQTDSSKEAENNQLKADAEEILREEQKQLKLTEVKAKADEKNKKLRDKEAKEKEKARQDELKNQEKVQSQLDSLEIKAIEDKRERESAELVAAFEKKVASIKGNSELEIQLEKELREQLRLALQEQKEEFDIEDEEKKLAARELELENRLILAGEDFEARKVVLEQQRELELSDTNLTKSQIAVINKKFNDEISEDEIKKADLKRQQRETDIQSAAALADALSGLAKDGSNSAKAFATASALINTYLAITGALANAALLGPFAVAAQVATASAIGLANVAKINGVTFEEGGFVEGASHDNGGIQMFQRGGQHLGEMEGGEYIISKDNVNRIGRSNLDALNFGEGSMNGFFANGGSVPSATGTATVRNAASSGLDMTMLANIISSEMKESIARIKVTNTATDTFETALGVINTESELSFG